MRGRDADLYDSGQSGLEAQEDTRARARANRRTDRYTRAANQLDRVRQYQQGDSGSHEQRQRGHEADLWRSYGGQG